MKDSIKIALITGNNNSGKEISDWSAQLREYLYKVLYYFQIQVTTIDLLDKFPESINDYHIYLPVLNKENVNDADFNNFLNTFESEKGTPDEKVILVLQERFSAQSQKSLLQKFVSIPLYIYNEYNRSFAIIDFSKVESLDDKIWLTILDIGYEIKRVIRQKESRGGAIEIPEEKNIFVAITTPDQQRYRQNLRRELQHLGINVLPNRHLPEDYHELKDRVEKCLAESFIFVHMLGYQYGSSLGDTASSIVELQNDIVTEYIREKTNLSANLDDTIRYVWINPDTELMTQEQKRYIEKIKTDKEFLKNTEIIETPFELFKTVIKARAEKESELKKGSEEEEQGLSSLYLIAENYDVPFLKKLESHLQEQNFRINKLIPDPPNVNLYSLHKKYLVDSSAVLVYYDQENSNWLNSKLSDILKAPGFGKKEPFQAKALIMDEKLESNIYSMTPDLKIIKFNNKGYQPEILDSFINQFRKQK